MASEWEWENDNCAEPPSEELRLLFISDDFVCGSFYMYISVFQLEEGHKVELINSLKEFDETKFYDIVFLDYGLIGDDINIVEKVRLNCRRLCWQGGLPERYNMDAKKKFPKQKFLHHLDAISLGLDWVFWIIEKELDSRKG